jgi:hypothetical protein
MTKANAIHQLKMHRFLMTMVRVVKNTRAADCEHCEAMLKDVYKCLDGELNDMRNRNNHE